MEGSACFVQVKDGAYKGFSRRAKEPFSCSCSAFCKDSVGKEKYAFPEVLSYSLSAYERASFVPTTTLAEKVIQHFFSKSTHCDDVAAFSLPPSPVSPSSRHINKIKGGGRGPPQKRERARAFPLIKDPRKKDVNVSSILAVSTLCVLAFTALPAVGGRGGEGASKAPILAVGLPFDAPGVRTEPYFDGGNRDR